MINFSGTENDVRIIAQDEIDKKHLEQKEMTEAQIDKSVAKALTPINDKLIALDKNLTAFKAGIIQSMKTNQRWTIALVGIAAVIATLLSSWKT